MKTQFLLILIAVLISKFSFGDIIINNTHYVSKCVKITNLEDYPDVAFIGYSLLRGQMRQVNQLSSTDCLNKGYRLNDFTVYAVNKSYLNGKDINKIEFHKDPNALKSNIAINPYLGFVPDSIPLSAVEEYYKVAGFSGTNVILYLWKKVTKYNNGQPDLIESFMNDGQMQPPYQRIMTGVSAARKQAAIEVYPNPTNRDIHLRINADYMGIVPVELVASNGKVLKSFTLTKSEPTLDYDITVANSSKGVFFVKVKLGKKVESKEISIQ